MSIQNTMLAPELERERRLTAREVARLRGCGLSKLWEDVRQRRFVQPIRQGRRFTRWRLGDVLDSLKTQPEAQ